MQAKIGKRVRGSVYFHVSAILSIEPELSELTNRACIISSAHLNRPWNVVSVDARKNKVSLLHYPHFLEDPFPALHAAQSVNLALKSFTYRTYTASPNPPILHRKELLLSQDDARRDEFARLTQELEEQGMYKSSQRIGFRRQWAARLSEARLEVKDHRVVELPGAASSRKSHPW